MCVWQIRTSDFIVSTRFCVVAYSYVRPFFPSVPAFPQPHRGPGVFGQFVPVALDFQADLANFWSVQYRKQFFFFPSLLDGCSWELIRAFAFVGVSRSV